MRLKYFEVDQRLEMLRMPHITLPGFQEPFRKDRNTKGGGVCIFLSNQLSGKRRSDLEDPDLELLWVEMKLSGYHRSLFVGCCYRPPQSGKYFF